MPCGSSAPREEHADRAHTRYRLAPDVPAGDRARRPRPPSAPRGEDRPPAGRPSRDRALQAHLIVRTDDGLGPEALAGVPSCVEVLYTDGMATRIALDGRTDEIPDARLDDLLAAIDEAGGLVVPAEGG